MPTRIVLIDDHRLVRAGIAALLRDLPGVTVIGEGASGAEAIELVSTLEPEVLFLDLVMPGMSGLDVLPRINESHPELKVIVLSMHASEEHVVRALQLGAVGYMLKDGAPTELAQALETVAKGEIWLSPSISRRVITDYLRRTTERDPPLDTLTQRQRQVLAGIAEGFGTREISAQLGLSIKTVETYRTQIMLRLDIHDVAGLVRYAIRHGVVPL